MTLDRETLELLLLDQDAGALGAETEKLLAVYLEQTPRAGAEAREIRATLALARETLAVPAKMALPKPEFDRDSAREGKPFPWRGWAPWLAAAACLAVGFAVGQAGASRSAIPARAAIALAQPLVKPNNPATQDKPGAVEKSGADGRADSFWSVRNLRPGANETPRRTAYTLEWDSPLKRPKIKTTL